MCNHKNGSVIHNNCILFSFTCLFCFVVSIYKTILTCNRYFLIQWMYIIDIYIYIFTAMVKEAYTIINQNHKYRREIKWNEITLIYVSFLLLIFYDLILLAFLSSIYIVLSLVSIPRKAHIHYTFIQPICQTVSNSAI